MDSTANIPMTICFGFCETGPYITQMLIREGKEIGCYRKTHLGSREKASYLAGDSLDVFRTEDAVIAMQLCWECHVPRETETYVRRGAELILMPHASGLGPGRRREVWDTILPARAYDNTVFIGACNAYGENGCGVRFGGGITARDPKGKLIDEDYGREHMLTVDLDPEDMERIRSGSPSTMADLFFMDGYRPDLYD
jgi:predicted amidohydrolase